ncbi:EamA family transporter [Micrococcales bacterium 31B]|nr:EamA family transporter [Micrococcales bacterium 31B]
MVSLQFGNALASTLFDQAGALGTSLLRLGLAGLILAAVMRPQMHRWSRAQWKNMAMLGVSLALMNGLFYEAIARIPLGVAVTIEFAGPLALALFSARRALDYVWVVLGLSGVALLSLTSHGLEGSSLDPIGVLAALGAGAFWALYIITGSRYSRREPPRGGLVGVYLCAAIVLLPFGLVGILQAPPSWGLLAAGLGVALLAAVIPFALEIKTLSILPKQTFSLLLPLEPALASLMGALLLAQHMTLLAAGAMVLVVVASAGATFTAKSA